MIEGKQRIWAQKKNRGSKKLIDCQKKKILKQARIKDGKKGIEDPKKKNEKKKISKFFLRVPRTELGDRGSKNGIDIVRNFNSM